MNCSFIPLARSPSIRRDTCKTRLSALCMVLAATLAPTPAAAVVYNFTGASSPDWGTAANWAEGVPVGAIDTEVVLNGVDRPASFNDIAGGLVLNRLTLGIDVASPVLSGQSLRFQGSNPLLSMLGTVGSGQVQTAVVMESTLTVQGGASTSSQLFLKGAISGSAGAGLQLASGRTVLSGGNTYSGATTISDGAVLGVAGFALAGTSGVNVAAGGELQIVSSNVVTTLNVPIQLGGLLSSSAKRINSLAGATDSAVVQGPVTLTGDARVLAFGATGTGLNSAALNVLGVVDRAGHELRLGTGGINNNLLVSSIVGTGTLRIDPAGGNITVGSITGNGDILAQGAAGAITLGGIAGDGVLRVAFDNTNGTANVAGVISGTRALEVSRGFLTLGSAANSFIGTVQLRDGGALLVGSESALGNAANTLRFDGGGHLSLTGSNGGLSRAIFTTGGMATINAGTNRFRTVSSVISGDGGMTFSGTNSQVVLSGSNSFAGGLGIAGVTLVFASDANLGQAGAPILLQSGGLALPAGFTLDRPLNLGGTSGSVSSFGPVTLAGPISGSGRLDMAGTGRFTLSGNVNHTGGVTLAGNVGAPVVLVLDSDSRLGAAGGVFNIGRPNGISTLPGTLLAAADLDIAASRSTSFADMTVDTAGHTVIFNQSINGLGMTKAGAGLWRLNTANGNDSNTNLVQVEEGTLQLGTVNALGPRANVSVLTGAVLDLDGNSQNLEKLDVGTGGRLMLGSNPTTQLTLRGGRVDGNIEGQGKIAIGSAGFTNTQVLLGGANSFTGGIVVSSGAVLSLNSTQGLGAVTNSLTLDDGVLATATSNSTPVVLEAARTLQIGPGGAVFRAAGQSLVVEQLLTGNAPLRFQGGSRPGEALKTEVRLSNTGNSFVGDVQLGDARNFGTAVLGIGADGALGASTNRVLLGNTFFNGESTRNASGGLRAFASFSLPASRIVQLSGSASAQFSGFIDTQEHTVRLQGGVSQASSGLSLLKTGSGTLIMNGVSTFTGTTFVEQGTLGGHGELQKVSIGAEATLAPGESAGLMQVRGNLSFTGGTLAMELGGTQRGSGHDALDVGGQVNLGDAALTLAFIDGFESRVLREQEFVLIQAGGGVFGSFANVADGMRLGTLGGEGSFVVHYGNGLGLVVSDYVTAVPEPGQGAMMLLGLLAVAGFAGRRRTKPET